MFGLTLAVYALWIGGTLHLVPYRRSSIILVLVLMFVAAAVLAALQRRQLRSFLREHWKYIGAVEGLFTVVFVTALYLRSFVPDITIGEKAMDFAFINAILRADYFPANDPWFSGHSNPLYYFGHLTVATLTKLTAIPSRITFNLAVALIPALGASMAFGLLYNLLVKSVRVRRAFVFGAVAVVFLLILANIEGVFEMMAAHSIGSAGLFKTFDFFGLTGAEPSPRWYPTQFWWIGRAVMIGSNWDLREFPFFSYLAGDLHAHIMALPFDLAALALLLNLWRSDHTFDGSYWRRHPLSLVVIAVVIGAIGFVNLWDLPTYLFLLILLALGKNYLSQGRLNARAIGSTAAFALPAVALALVAYIPFYRPSLSVAAGFPWLGLSFGLNPEGAGLAPWEAATTYLQVEAVATRPHHFIYFWLPFVWLALAFAVVAIGGPIQRSRRFLLLLLPGLAPVLAFAIAILLRRGVVGLWDEIATRGVSWVTIALLVSLIALILLALLRQARREDVEAKTSSMFALGLAGTAFLLLLGIEFFWVQEPTGARFNTLFRTTYQAWILLSMAAAFGAHYVLANWKVQRLALSLVQGGWRVATVLIILAALVYVVPATFYRTNDFSVQYASAGKVLGIPKPWSLSPGQTLDGLAYVTRGAPDEDAAIAWLAAVDEDVVVLEAVGDDWNSSHARVSGRTGLQTVLGWPYHESRWRGIPLDGEGEIVDRTQAVETLYTTTDVDSAKAILAQYDVVYVYVGAFEREKYGKQGLPKFDSFLEVAYSNDSVTIYRVPDDEQGLVSNE